MEAAGENAADDNMSVEEESTESLDDDGVDPHAPHDPTGSKNRSKRKPSKTQIKHIAPKDENCDTSKYGTQNMEDLFNDVTQGIYRGTQSQLAAQAALIAGIVPTQSPSAQSTPVQVASAPLAPAPSDQTPPAPNQLAQTSLTPVPTPTPTTTKRPRRSSSHASASSTRSMRSLSSRPPPSYPCGICGKVFRVPSRYDSHMLGHSKGKPFCCNTCGKMFASQEKLDYHLPVHNCDRSASFTCECCGKVCVNWRAYLYHLKAKHTESGGKRFTCNVSRPKGGKRFSCNLCGRQFHTGQRLRNHMASHEIGKNHCCQICGKLFESKKKLDTHVMVHNLTSKHNQHLQCSDCGREYSEWIAFKQHMKTHGAEGVEYPCGLCEMVFPTQYEKEKHKRVHKQVQCEFCERFFRSASVLSVHLRVHTGERPYKCGLCERDFSQSSVLKVHMRTHRKEGKYECKRCGTICTEVMEFFKHHMAHLEEGNLQCEECGKVFENINNKNRHMAAHRDRSGRVCQVCSKEFGRVSHLEAHMLCHSDQLPLLCKVCGKMFPSQEVLTAHYATHMTGEKSNSGLPSSKGPLFCGLCGKMFKGQVFLNNHMKKHEREGVNARVGDEIPDEDVVVVEGGEFKCTDCGKAFGRQHHLTVHKREHTGERPHTCILCGQSFMFRKQLLEHIGEHKRNGLMLYMGGQGSGQGTKKGNASKSKENTTNGSDTGSETETDCDNEENENVSKTPTVQTNYKMATPATSITVAQSFTVTNPQESQGINSSFQEKTYPRTVSNSYPEKSYGDVPSALFEVKNYAQDSTTPYNGRDYLDNTDKSYHEKMYTSNSHGSVGEKNYIDSSNSGAFTDKNYMSNSNSSIPEKRYLSSPSNSFHDKPYIIDNQKLPYQDESPGIIRDNRSPVSFNETQILHYNMPRRSYNQPISPSSHLPVIGSSHLHSTLQNEHFTRPGIHMPLNNRMQQIMHPPMKESVHANIHMIRPEPHLPSSVHHDYKSEMGAYAFPYGKAHMPSAINNLPTRSSFHTSFHTQSSRFPSDAQLSMTNFQLLPQTAFPENSHQA